MEHKSGTVEQSKWYDNVFTVHLQTNVPTNERLADRTGEYLEREFKGNGLNVRHMGGTISPGSMSLDFVIE